MKCEICGKKIEENFLQKRIGTIVKDSKGKKHDVCSECQSKLKDKDEMLKNL